MCRATGCACGFSPASTRSWQASLHASSQQGEQRMPADARSRSALVTCAAAAMYAVLACGAQGEESLQAQIPGMVRQTEIRIAPDTTGRLATIAVKPGDHVHRGDLLAKLD